jgi:HSP20 family molecular chaperone IbpA
VDFIARRPSATPASHPNHPDVDVRDTGTDYVMELEVPGLKDVQDIQCRWASSRTLTVSGTIRRPPVSEDDKTADNPSAPPDTHGVHSDGPPYLLIGERKTGPFRRIFTFPAEVEMEQLNAWLEAGLLSLKVPKKGAAPLKDDGLVKIHSRDG